MKNIPNLPVLNCSVKSLVLIAFSVFFFSCNLSRSNKNSPEVKQFSASEQMLVNQAYQNLYFCLKISEEAYSRSTTLETHQLAGKILNDHSKRLSELEKFAQDKNFVLMPGMTDEQLEKWKKLIRAKGRNFDGDYVMLLLQEHDKVNTIYRTMAHEKDSELNLFSQASLIQTLSHMEDATKAKTIIDGFIQRGGEIFISAKN